MIAADHRSCHLPHEALVAICNKRRQGPEWIKWREGGRIRYKGGLESSELADQIRAKIVADIQAGRAGLPTEPRDVPALGALADGWLKRREPTHRASRADRSRWKKHLRPLFGDARPSEIDHASIRRFVESKLAAGLNASTVGHCIRLLSSFFSDLAERGLVSDNPIRTLPRSTRRLYRATTDPRTTPFPGIAPRGSANLRHSTLTWHQATRHTFASHWVLSGGSLEKLAKVMGHNSIVVTEQYAHLKVTQAASGAAVNAVRGEKDSLRD